MKTLTVLFRISYYLFLSFLPFVSIYCWNDNFFASLMQNTVIFYSCVLLIITAAALLFLMHRKIIFFCIFFLIFLFTLPSFDSLTSCNAELVAKYANAYDFAIARYISSNIRDNCRIDYFFSSKDNKYKKSNYKLTVIINNPLLKTKNAFFVFSMDDIQSALINNHVLYASKAYNSYVKKSYIESLKSKYRTMCFTTIFNRFSMLSAGVFFAIVYGDKSFINKNVYNSFIKTGTAHLLALSGLHLGLLLLIISYFSKNSLIYLTASLCFLVITGMNTSLIRAFFTLFFGILPSEKKFRINYTLFPLFILYATYMLSPYSIASVSFLLSLSAIYGIFFSLHIFKQTKKIPSLVKTMLMSIFVTVFQFPFILQYFKSVPLFSWLFNITAIPLFTATIHFGLLSFIFNPYNIYNNVAEYFLYFFAFITAQFAKISLAYTCNSTNYLFLIGYIVFLLSLYYVLCNSRKHTKNNV